MPDTEVSTAALAEAFHSLSPWGDAAAYSDAAWAATTQVAEIVQQADPNTVEAACQIFLSRTSDYEEMSKLFILMRFVFDLPEKAPADKRFNFAAWARANADVVQPGYVNLAWPLSFVGGRPILTHDRPVAQGPPYRAAEEYRYLLTTYGFRNLAGRGADQKPPRRPIHAPQD